MKADAMDDLLPQRQLADTSSVRVALIDYVVLQVVEHWNVLARETRSDNGFASEQAGARLRALMVLVAGELVRDGFPIELGLQFQNPDLPGLGIVTSAAIDDAIESMIDAGCLPRPDRGVPLYTLTSKGDFYLQRAKTRIAKYEDVFLGLPDIFFASADLTRYYPKTAPKVRLRERISEMVRDCYDDSIPELRLKMIRLGAQIVDEGAPRGYYFHKKFRELAPLQKMRPAELSSALRGASPP